MTPTRMLAEYFTGENVAHHSVGLQVGGVMKVRADKFFAVRAALGITGYVSIDEAHSAIKNALEKS